MLPKFLQKSVDTLYEKKKKRKIFMKMYDNCNDVMKLLCLKIRNVIKMVILLQNACHTGYVNQ